MSVKTVFKTIFLTITLICVGTFLAELYNASVNSALLRQKLDSAAESSLNYYNQESFRADQSDPTKAADGTINLPNFASSDNPLNVYVSGTFYDHADNPIQQAAEMFDWYAGGTNSLGYNDSNAVKVYELAMLNASGHPTYSYHAYVGGEDLGFDYHCRRLPTVNTNLSPYNLTVPGKIGAYNPSGNGNAITFSQMYSGYPKQYLGVVNRYTEDINELTRWNSSSEFNNIGKITVMLDKYRTRTSGGSNNQYSTTLEFEQIYGMGGLNPLMHIEDAVQNGYTPANTGFPMFSWQLNRMFRWHLCSTLSGVGVEVDPATGSYTTPAIDMDENGVECIRWNGFNVYANHARITDINYYAYNLYDSSDLSAFCTRAGLDRNTFIANSQRYTTPGYTGNAFPNTVVDPDGKPFSFAMIVDIEYEVPVAYRGVTPFRRVINWVQHDRVAGYGGFVNDNTNPTASGLPDAVYADSVLTGAVGDNAFMVDSALQYVIMP